jgi:hypothetical protein
MEYSGQTKISIASPDPERLQRKFAPWSPLATNFQPLSSIPGVDGTLWARIAAEYYRPSLGTCLLRLLPQRTGLEEVAMDLCRGMGTYYSSLVKYPAIPATSSVYRLLWVHTAAAVVATCMKGLWWRIPALKTCNRDVTLRRRRTVISSSQAPASLRHRTPIDIYGPIRRPKLTRTRWRERGFGNLLRSTDPYD